MIVRGQRRVFDDANELVFPSDPGPYDPCWCFSGKKFKFCHQKRHLETEVPPAQFMANWDAPPALRTCLHPDAPAGCGDKIIAAHSVQRRGSGLGAIARGGKVYGFKLHPMFFFKKNLRLDPELVGVGDTSTFSGFCDVHDSELFRPLEVCPFEGSAQQLFLLSFRCFAHRYHYNQRSVGHASVLATADRGMDRHAQRRHFIVLEQQRLIAEQGLANSGKVKTLYDEEWRDGQFRINGLVVYLRGLPEVICSAIVDCDVDFHGQELPPPTPPEHLCFSVLSTGTGAAAVWSWLGPNDGAARLCRSFLELEAAQQPRALLRYLLDNVDTPYFSPSWWEQLNVEARGAIVEQMTEHMRPFRQRPQDALITGYLAASNLLVERSTWLHKGQEQATA